MRLFERQRSAEIPFPKRDAGQNNAHGKISFGLVTEKAGRILSRSSTEQVKISTMKVY
jgi:hypothetical protein